MAVQRVYSDEDRAALVAEIFAGKAILRAAEDRGVPYSTARDWYEAALQGRDEPPNPLAKAPVDHAALWSAASERASRLIAKTLDKYDREDRDIAPRELQNIAIVGGISRDAHLDYRDGRTKGGVNIDNRSVHVQLTSEQAAALVAEAQRRGQLTTQDQPTAPTLPEAPPPPTT